MDFLVFDGEDPKLWLSRCDDYFDIYSVEPSQWIRCATMKMKVKSIAWDEFCKLVLDRFGRDQYELLIRQLFHIRQSGRVQEYADRFTGLVDQLIAYGKNTDPLFYAMRFVDGLRDDICSAVSMQHPSSIDAACVLALLQEELVDAEHRKSPSKFPPTSPPATGHDRGGRALASGAPADDRRPRGVDVEDKLATLRSYRHARSLCIHCGEKWSRDHKCPEALQLHALQEFWEMCNGDDSACSEEATSKEESPQVFAIQVLANIAAPTPVRSIHLEGMVQGIPIHILVDSGSSCSFVSTSLASKLTGGSTLSVPPRVRIADGNLVECSQSFSKLTWEVQQCQFTTSFLALSMPSYDMIFGMDWLVNHSPMQIDWQNKWL
jgi:hypothetical protein